MKFKQKKSSKPSLSDKIADALTVKPRADIEDDHIFNTKPNTVSRADYSSDSEDEAAISDFRKRSINLLSEISKKYEGQVVSRKELEKKYSNANAEEESDSELSEDEIPKKLKGLMSDDEGSQESDENISKNNKLKVPASEGLTSDDDENDESDDYSIMANKGKVDSKEGSDNEDEGSDEDKGSDEDEGLDEDEGSEDEGKGYDISQMEEPVQEEFEHVIKKNISEEAKKGMGVRNQLLLWEGLLEMRIHLQRCMNTVNRMPMSDTYDTLKTHNEFVAESGVTVNTVAKVLDKFLTLQNLLLKKFPETNKLSNKTEKAKENEKAKEGSDEEIPSDTDNEEIPSDTDGEEDVIPEKKEVIKKTNQKKRKLEDYESEIAASHKAFKIYRDTTIQKWNEKTRLASASNIKNTPTNTILQQISYILSDRDKLIHRTQLKRSDYDIIGFKSKPTPTNNMDQNEINPITRDRKDNDEYIPEIFDDSDFYHQLLRELIECKSADISDPVQLSRQWIALQQMRSKMKRKVDTKATKGRKIKYVVHNKLVSYMAPEKSIKWNDESTNELYSSLFGKMYENNNVGTNVNLDIFNLKN